MSIIWKLVIAQARHHPARMWLTALAIMAAACVVVWVVSGYDALLAQFEEFAPEYLGRYDLVVVPPPPSQPGMPGSYTGPPIPAELIAALEQDPAVAALDPVVQSQVMAVRSGAEEGSGFRVQGSGARRIGNTSPRPSPPKFQGSRVRGQRPGPRSPLNRESRPPGFRMGPPRPVLEGTNAAEPPYPMAAGRWIDPAPARATGAASATSRMEAALSRRTAEELAVGVGDTLIVESEAGEFRLKLVGLVEQATLGGPGRGPMGPRGLSRGPATSALYVPVALAERINGRPAAVSFVSVALKDHARAAEFRARWLAEIAAQKYPATILALGDVEEELKGGFAATRLRNQAYAATGISLLAALFIILTTLSMGVSERVRQFAMLRAIALTRAHVACMIVAESLVLAVIGWLGGLAAGWGLLWIMGIARPEVFRGGDLAGGPGASLGSWAVLLSGVCAFGGALAASILPACNATRIRPLDAMLRATGEARGTPRLLLPAVAAGLLLIAVNPLLLFVVPMAEEARYGVYLALGCTSMAIGFVLLAPLAILATERILGPLVARLLRLDGRLLGAQLTSNLGRTLGTTVALTLGLGLFVAMQTWGYSMLGPFVPGDWVPQVLVCFQYGGLPDAEIDAVGHLQGVIPEQCLPLAVAQPKLAEDITGSQRRTSVTRQDNVVLIGLDPEAGLGGPDPLLKLQFVQGSRDQAVQRLQQGRYCIVPDHFQRETGLGLGDRFKMIPPGSPDQPVEYTIAGVAAMPGWHWMTKFSGLRRRSGRSAAMVFAPFDDVRGDFNLKRTNFFWLNTEKGVSVEDLGAALQPIAQRNLGERQPVNAQGTWPVGATMFGPSLRITTAEEIRSRIGTRADGMIWGMCQLPLVTLAVTSLGVVGAMLASVRARRWEMGILRAVGLTRFGLVRLILAEALLIALVACLLSLGFGVMAGWCGTSISQYVSFFGGLNPALVVPWSKLAIGFAATLLLCLAATLWPAVSTGCTEPLKLLQAGRTAT